VPTPTTVERISVPAEDRFERFRLIGWWDQRRISAAKVLVVGAGALGNEILKNLALLGFENLVVVDLDAIELSNLSRTVLYRADDIGKPKAAVAAEAVRRILPSARVQPLDANILQDVGLGLFGWANIVIAGLDNREARLWINRCAWKMNRPWIDGAIEGISGLARVFIPGKPPCYECTLGEVDWQILEKRLSCNLLTRAEMETGKVPTTPTTASIVAGIEVQEAVKLLHGLPTLESSAFVFEGLNHSSYRLTYTENPDCMSHHTFEEVMELTQSSDELTLRDLHSRAQEDLGADAIVEFSRDIVHRLDCPKCGSSEEVFAAVGSVSYERGRCPRDGEMRIVVAVHSFAGAESFGARRLSELGLPLFDVFVARTLDREIAYLIAGDRDRVLRVFAAGEAAV
jgi:molybdopterin/thiamine biosynthesis adenylyltransferase